MNKLVLSRPRLVIFDMDGTLIKSMLDFDRMREEIGIDEEPLLEAIEKMEPSAQERALEILHRHEELAAAASELQEGAHDVLAAFRQLGIPLALMTRNSRASVSAFLSRHEVIFELIRTREDGICKPSPQPVFEICRHFKVDPRDAWVIGDYLYDIQCGAAAGSNTILLLDRQQERPGWADQADLVIYGLGEMLLHGDLSPDRSVA
jgi:HAD superfamily hydrolase (TIGR01549 family)